MTLATLSCIIFLNAVSSFIVTLVSASESRRVKILPKMADDVLWNADEYF